MAREESDTELYLGEYVSDSEESSESNFQIVASVKAVEKPSSSTVKKTVKATKWTEKQVIALLEAVIQYHREKGDPENDRTGYYSFIKEKICREGAMRKHIYEKLRYLKMNFEKTKATLEQNGGAVNASPHDINVFELSNMIWSSGDENVHVPKEKRKGESDKNHTTSDNVVGVPGKGKGKKGDHIATGGDVVVPKRKRGEGENGNHTTTIDVAVVSKDKGGEGEGERDIEWCKLSATELREMEVRFRKKYRHLYNSVDESRIVVLDHLFMIDDDKANELNDLLFQLNVREEKLLQKMRKLSYLQGDLIQNTLESPTTV